MEGGSRIAAEEEGEVMRLSGMTAMGLLASLTLAGCQMQLSLGVKRRGLRARVVHPSQLLAQAYRESNRE